MADTKKKLLIIEDDPFLGDVLVQKFKFNGYEAELSKDGREGFERISKAKPDLILLDVLLPSMSGYEILEAKEKDPAIKSIPVIIISNSGQPVEINRALALGVKDYLIKAQFDPEEVMVKVRNQLRDNAVEEMSGSESDGSRPLSGKKILWVEDDKFLSDIIARKLGAAGCVLVHAVDADDAMRSLKRGLPDIILLDIMLSGIDGFEILRRLKSEERTKNIPVIMLSNLGQKEDIEKGKKFGAARFLIKATVNLDEIIAEISAVLAEAKNNPSK